MKRLLIFLAICLPLYLAIFQPMSIYAQSESDVYSAEEVCAIVEDVSRSLDDEERQLDPQIHLLEDELSDLRAVAAQMVEQINPHQTTAGKTYANTMYWLTMLRIQGVRNQIFALEQRRLQIQSEREIFSEIGLAFACGEEEEDEEAAARSTPIGSACNVSGGLIGDQAERMHELTFIAVEDPDPTQEGWRWIELRLATTYDEGQFRNPEIWLERAIAWSESKQDEGWIELVRGSRGEFCSAIAANCITPPSGMSPDMFETICGPTD